MPPSVTKQIGGKPRPTVATSNAVDMDGLASAWDLSTGIKILLWGRSGTGKTVTWSSFPGPILAIICSGGSKPGELRSVNTPELRKKINPRIATKIQHVRDLVKRARDFETVVLDHASGLQDLVLAEILGLSELPAQKGWGLASQQQYGQCTLQCKEVLRDLLSLSANVVIVAQERQFNGEGEQSEILAPYVGAALSPSLTGWLNSAVDYIGQTFIRPKEEVVTRTVGSKAVETRQRVKGEFEYCLRTGPHDVYQTKFRVPKGRDLPDAIVDPDYDKIQALINGEG